MGSGAWTSSLLSETSPVSPSIGQSDVSGLVSALSKSQRQLAKWEARLDVCPTARSVILARASNGPTQRRAAMREMRINKQATGSGQGCRVRSAPDKAMIRGAVVSAVYYGHAM